MKKIISILAMILLIIMDQIIKYVIVVNFKVGEGFAIFKDILHIEYVQNTGAAWGMMSGATLFFAIFAIIMVSGMLWMLYKIPSDKKYVVLSWVLVFLMSGAIGNLIDRVTRAYVVDYIYFKLIDFPVFNLADIYITVSGVVLVFLIIFFYKDEDFEFLKISTKVGKNEKK